MKRQTKRSAKNINRISLNNAEIAQAVRDIQDMMKPVPISTTAAILIAVNDMRYTMRKQKKAEAAK